MIALRDFASGALSLRTRSRSRPSGGIPERPPTRAGPVRQNLQDIRLRLRAAGKTELAERLERGETVQSTRGPAIRDFRATELSLAFPDDGLASDGTPVDAKMLAGLTVAKERGMSAPGIPSAVPTDAGQEA